MLDLNLPRAAKFLKHLHHQQIPEFIDFFTTQSEEAVPALSVSLLPGPLNLNCSFWRGIRGKLPGAIQ